MAEGFKQMDALAVSGCKPRHAFGKVFGDIPFISSTYSDNIYIWNNYRHKVIEAASKGRSRGGEWADMIKLYGKRANGKGGA
jgi:hypothetical protein